MRPILVLGPERPGAPALERGQLDLCRVPPTAEVVPGAGVYDAVIVINDGGADAIHRVRLALDLHGRRGLAVGVLTYLADPVAELADWPALWPQFKVELKEAMLSLEYQAD